VGLVSRHSDKPWIAYLPWNQGFRSDEWRMQPPDWWIAIHGRFSAPSEATLARIEYATRNLPRYRPEGNVAP
jgi:hypothetical protein